MSDQLNRLRKKIASTTPVDLKRGIVVDPNKYSPPAQSGSDYKPLHAKYDIGLTPGMDQAANRERNQTARQALGNAVLRSLGELTLGTLEGFGHLADVQQHYNIVKGTETEFTNWFSDIFSGLQEKVDEAAPIFYDKEFSINSFADPKWWAQSLPQLANSLSLLIPATAAAKGASMLGKGMKGLAAYNKLSKAQKATKTLRELAKSSTGMSQVGEGITGAIASRFMENTLEAQEQATAKYNELLQKGFTDTEARLQAGEVGRNVWLANLPLVLTDFYQYQKIFRPLTTLTEGVKRKGLKTVIDYAKTMGSEGLEEATQYGIGKEADGSKNFVETLSKINFRNYSDDPEFWEAISLGAIGGAVFQGVPDLMGAASKKIKSFLAADTPVKQSLEAKKEVQEIVDSGNTEQLEELIEQEPDPEIKARVQNDLKASIELNEAVPLESVAREEIVENVHKQAAIEEQIQKNKEELALKGIATSQEAFEAELATATDEAFATHMDRQRYGEHYKVVDTQIKHIESTLKNLPNPESLTYKQYESKLKELQKQKEKLKGAKVKPVINSNTPVVEKLAKDQVDLTVEQAVTQKEFEELKKSPEKILEEKKQKELEQLTTDLKEISTPAQLQNLLPAFQGNKEASDMINQKVQKEVQKELKDIESVEEINPENYPFTAAFEPQRLAELESRLKPGQEVEVGEVVTTPDNTIEVLSKSSKSITVKVTNKKSKRETTTELTEGAIRQIRIKGSELYRKYRAKLSDYLNELVIFKGKPYKIGKEGQRFILESLNEIIELTSDDVLLDTLGISLPIESTNNKYDITDLTENTVTVNGVTYSINTNANGNIVGLTIGKQRLTNERLLVAVEIERNKKDFKRIETDLTVKEKDFVISSDTRLTFIQGIYEKNYSDTIENALEKIYNGIQLSKAEALALDLWVTEAIMELEKLYVKDPHTTYGNALDNLEIINHLLYSDNYKDYEKEFTELDSSKSTKRRIRQKDYEVTEKRQGEVTKLNKDTTQEEVNKTADSIIEEEIAEVVKEAETTIETTEEDGPIETEQIITRPTEEFNKEEPTVLEPISHKEESVEEPVIEDLETEEVVSDPEVGWEGRVYDIEGVRPEQRDMVYKSPNAPLVSETLNLVRNFAKYFKPSTWNTLDVFFEVDKDLPANKQNRTADNLIIHAVVYKDGKRYPIAVLPFSTVFKDRNFQAFRNYLFDKALNSTDRIVQAPNPVRINHVKHGNLWKLVSENNQDNYKPIKEVLQGQPLILGVVVRGEVEVGLDRNSLEYKKLFDGKNIITPTTDYKFDEGGTVSLIEMPNGNWMWHKVSTKTLAESESNKARFNEIFKIAMEASREIKPFKTGKNKYNEEAIKAAANRGELPNYVEWMNNATGFRSEIQGIVRVRVSDKGNLKYEPDFNANLIKLDFLQKNGVLNPSEYIKWTNKKYGVSIAETRLNIDKKEINNGDYNDKVANDLLSPLNPGTLFHSPSFEFSPYKLINEVADIEETVVEEVIPEEGRDMTQKELDEITEQLGIRDRIQQSYKEGDNKITVKWVTPDGKVFNKQEDAVRHVVDSSREAPITDGETEQTISLTQKKPVKFTKPVIDKFKGKIVYATPGSGKTYVAEGREDIVDGDVVIEQVLRDMGLYNDKFSLGQNIFYNRNKIEQPFKIRLRQLAEEGKTVLTGNKFAIDVADIAILIPDSQSIVSRTKDRSNPIKKAGAISIRENELSLDLADAQKIPLANDQYISDLLFKQETKLTPGATFKFGGVPDIDFKLYDGSWDSSRISSKELNKVKKLLPSNVSIESVKGIIKVGDVNAWGISAPNLVKLSRLAPYGTGYHEAFHQVFGYLLTNKEQKDLLDEARAKSGLTDVIELEEWLADKFADYQNNLRTDVGSKLRRFFKRLLEWIRLAFNYKSTIDGTFARMDVGYFNSRSYSQTKNIVRFHKTNLSIAQENELADLSLNLLDRFIQQFAEGGTLNIVEGYKKALNKNLDKNLILSTKVDSVVMAILSRAKGLGGNTDPKVVGNIVRQFLPGFAKVDVETGEILFVEGKEKEVGPMYEVVLRKLYTRGLDVQFNESQFQGDTEFEYDESDDYREAWSTQNLSISVKEKLTPRLRRYLYSIKNGKTDSLGLGIPTTYNGTEMYSILQKAIGSSTDVDHMIEKLNEKAKYHSFFGDIAKRLNNYADNTNQNEFATLLYFHLAQNQKPRTVTILDSDAFGIYTVNSNRFTLLGKIKNEFKEFDDTKEYAFTKEEHNSKLPNISKAQTFLASVNLPVSGEVITKMQANGELYQFLKDINLSKKDKYGATDSKFDTFVETYANYRLDHYQDSFLNVEGSRTYEWITNSFIGELIAGLNSKTQIRVDRIKAKYGEYAALPMMKKVGSHQFEFVVVDGIKDKGATEGRKYSSFSDIDMLKTMLTLAKKGIYTVPTLSDSPNMVGVKMPQYKDNEVVDRIVDVVRLDKNKSIFGIDPNANKEDIVAALRTKANHQLSLLKQELEKYKLRGEFNDRFLEAFVVNYMLNHSQLILATTGDPKFYGNPDKFFKRAKEIWSPGTHPTSKAFFETAKGQRIQPPVKMKIKVREDVVQPGTSIEKLKTVLTNIGRKDLIEKYENVTFTDAQTYIDLVSYRWREVGMGRWNHSKQAAYDIYEKGGTLHQSDVKTLRKAIKADIAKAKKEGNSAEVKRLEQLRIPAKDSFQPFKPFYYDLQLINDILTPVQKKDSEFLILPIYGVETMPFYNPKYKEMLEEMGYDFDKMTYKYGENPDIIQDRITDLHTFDTAMKVGIREGLGELNFDSWRLQQEVPEHHKDVDGIFGTQIMKLIIADINPDLEYSGIKGSELIREYEELIIADINRSYNKILGELEVKDTEGKLNRKATFDKLVKRLEKEVINRGLGDEYLEALDQPGRTETHSEALTFIQDTNLPLWHPLHSHRIESLMNSMFKKEITKQKFTNGFVFTNAAPWGFEREPVIVFKGVQEAPVDFKPKIDDIYTINNQKVKVIGVKENHIRYQRVSDSVDGGVIVSTSLDSFKKDTGHGIPKDSIDYLEAYVPIYDKRLEKYIDKTTGIIPESAMKDIPSDLLEGIVYRIPTEDKYSMFRIKVIGFLPANTGVIALPSEVTVIAGLDYDIDSVKGFFKGVQPIRKVQEVSEKIKELREELREEISNIKDTEVQASFQEAINDLNEANVLREQRFTEAGKNLLLEYMPENVKDLFSSLSLAEIKNINKSRYTKGEGNLRDQYGEQFEDIATIKSVISGFNSQINDIVNQALDTISNVKEIGSNIKSLIKEIETQSEELYEEVDDPKWASDKRKIELMESVLRSEHMTESFLNPGGYDQIVDNNYYIRWAKNKKVRAKYPKYENFDALDGRTKEKLLTTTTPYYSPFLQIEMARRMNTGKALIGGAAVNNVVHSMFQRSPVQLDLVYGFKFLGETFTNLNQTVDHFGKKISKNFASFLAAFVDNGKDPQAEYFNMNAYTAPVAYAMTHAGVPSEVVQKFLAAKSIEKFVRRYENLAGDEWATKNFKGYRHLNLNKLKINTETTDLTLEEIEEGLTADENSYLGQKLLVNFLVYKLIATSTQSFVSAAKLGDRGAGPTQASNIIKLRTVYDDIANDIIKDHDKIVSGASDFLTTPTFMTEFVDKGIKKVNEWIIEHGGFPDLTNSSLGAVLNKFEEDAGKTLKEFELREFYENFIEFLAYSHPEFAADFDRLKGIENRVEAAKTDPKYKDIRIIEYLVPENGLTFRAPVGTDNTEIQSIRDSWKKLHTIDPALSTDLAYYSFQRDGFSVSLGSFSQYQPAFIYINNVGFTEFLRKKIELLKGNNNELQELMQQFKQQFIRNHFEKLRYLPTFTLGETLDKFPPHKLNKDGKIIAIALPADKFTNVDGWKQFVKLVNNKGDKQAIFKHTENGIYGVLDPLKVNNKKLYGADSFNLKNPNSTPIDVTDFDAGFKELVEEKTSLKAITKLYNAAKTILFEKWGVNSVEELKRAIDLDPEGIDGIARRIKEC